MDCVCFPVTGRVVCRDHTADASIIPGNKESCHTGQTGLQALVTELDGPGQKCRLSAEGAHCVSVLRLKTFGGQRGALEQRWATAPKSPHFPLARAQ